MLQLSGKHIMFPGVNGEKGTGQREQKDFNCLKKKGNKEILLRLSHHFLKALRSSTGSHY